MTPFWIVSSAYRTQPIDSLLGTVASLGLHGVELCLHRKDNKLDGKTDSPLDYDHFGPDQANALIGKLNRLNLHISLSAYHRILGAPADEKQRNIDHLLKLIRMAYLLGGNSNNVCVGTFVGFDHQLGNTECGFEKNLDAYRQIFGPIIRYAESLGVTILYENCPMPAWEPHTTPHVYNNLPATLGARKLMYHLLPSPAHAETYDPSHDIWQFIDPCEVIRHSDMSRIRRIHIKSTCLGKDAINTHWGNVFPIPGISRTLGSEAGVPLPEKTKIRFNHQPALPGYNHNGNLNWKDFLSLLAEKEYRCPLVIENEVTGNHSAPDEAASEAFAASLRYLQSLAWPGETELVNKPLKLFQQKDIPLENNKSIL